MAIAYAYGNNAAKTKEQALIIEKQSLNFLRLTLHVVAHMDEDFIEAFGVEPRWLRKAKVRKPRQRV